MEKTVNNKKVTEGKNSELFPEQFEHHNPYNIPVHDQGNKNSCTAHAFALMMEYQLSDFYKERTLIDVDDLWEKQKKFGTASEERGDLPDGPYIIAAKYGVRYRTDSGKTGTLLFSGKKRNENGIMVYDGWTVREDNPQNGANGMDTIHGLQQEIQRLLLQIQELSGGDSVPIERIERYLSDFTQRTSTLLTIAALMSGLAVVQPAYLKMFLITSFPLFVSAIFFYLLSARRLNLLSPNWSFGHAQMLKKTYTSVRKWHILTDLSLTSFFAAFVINVYLFAFGVQVSLRDILFSYIIALLAGGMRYFYIKGTIPPLNTESDTSAVGGSPPDEMFFAGAPAPTPPNPSDGMEK